MRINNEETMFTAKYLKLVTKNYATENGHEGVWEMVERTNVPNNIGAVVIIPMTRKKELIFEKNWRVPLETPVIQFPAGLIDKEGESAEEVARRELLEETGYIADKLMRIIQSPECAVLTPTLVDHFFAPDVEYVGNNDRENTEEIEVIRIPVKECLDFILDVPKGTMIDLRVPGILWILEKKGLIPYLN